MLQRMLESSRTFDPSLVHFSFALALPPPSWVIDRPSDESSLQLSALAAEANRNPPSLSRLLCVLYINCIRMLQQFICVTVLSYSIPFPFVHDNKLPIPWVLVLQTLMIYYHKMVNR
jgi:hypothetical protein